jgi:hypothetical protein
LNKVEKLKKGNDFDFNAAIQSDYVLAVKKSAESFESATTTI